MTTELYLKIRDYLREIIRDTEWEGHVFAVGGCCRDEIMGLPIKDVDMAVDLPTGGIRFAQWLREKRLTVYEPVTFPNYGTAMLRLRAFPEDEIELVQTRKEKYTDRNRRNPETVFGSLEDDCMRRDLTINSLYYDITRQQFVDITGKGIEDIRNHIIRTPSDPDFTYDDDPLRILRCIRFASRFGWEIEKETFEGMVRNHERLKIITAERVRTELDKMLLCDHPAMALEMMRNTGALEWVIPKLWPVAEANGEDWKRVLSSMSKLPANLVLRLAALLSGIKLPMSPKDTDSILRRLKYSNEIIDEVSFMLAHANALAKDSLSDAELRRLQYICKTAERFDLLLTFIHSLGECNERVEEVLKRSKKMNMEGTLMFGFKLPLSGKDVMRILSLAPGPEVKQCLDLMMEEAFRNPLLSPTDFESFLKRLNQYNSSVKFEVVPHWLRR